MEKYVISRDSWHYKVAAWLTHWRSLRDISDICEYRWWVIWGFGKMIVAVLLGVWLIGGLIVFPAISMIVEYQAHGWNWDVLLAYFALGDARKGWEVFFFLPIMMVGGLTVLVLGVMLVFSMKYAWDWFSEKISKKKKSYEPSFIRVAWSSFKDKYCVPVTFE